MNQNARPQKPGTRLAAFKPAKSVAMDVDKAEALAATCLAHLAEDPSHLSRFMTETGIGPDDLRAQAGSRDVLVAVLEHVLGDESLLLVLTSAQATRPEALIQALQVLQTPALGSL